MVSGGMYRGTWSGAHFDRGLLHFDRGRVAMCSTLPALLVCIFPLHEYGIYDWVVAPASWWMAACLSAWLLSVRLLSVTKESCMFAF